MKIFSTIIFFLAAIFHVNSQGTWVQMANYPTAVSGAAGFSIGTKGYIGTGFTSQGNISTFWEYDKTTNVWTQKANYGGGEISLSVGFSIGNKGYIGTGGDTITVNSKQFWEYNPASNLWTKKAGLAGIGRNSAMGFSIGNKGYICGGVNQSNQIIALNDLWEYDPITNSWSQKANLPGLKRQYGIGFSIANKGYIGLGADSLATKCYQDFWEWDQTTNTWSQKANFPGGKRFGGYGYSIGNYGYVGMGEDSTWKSYINDLWQYFPFTNTWKQVISFPGGARQLPVGFSIGCSGFFGTGADTSYNNTNDWWEYIPDTITASISGANTICFGDSVSL
ncbi:MAG TPA: kelch repeat-containing protein, partial [Bacteroidia bacterium]